jgi:hypothetical protein
MHELGIMFPRVPLPWWVGFHPALSPALRWRENLRSQPFGQHLVNQQPLPLHSARSQCPPLPSAAMWHVAWCGSHIRHGQGDMHMGSCHSTGCGVGVKHVPWSCPHNHPPATHQPRTEHHRPKHPEDACIPHMPLASISGGIVQLCHPAVDAEHNLHAHLVCFGRVGSSTEEHFHHLYVAPAGRHMQRRAAALHTDGESPE